jgi:hypothetical protein
MAIQQRQERAVRNGHSGYLAYRKGGVRCRIAWERKMSGKWSALLLVAICTSAQAAISEGTYSNVCMHRETGDLLGIQLEIKYDKGKPSVLLWSCEGECGRALITSELAANNDQVAFTGTQEGTEHPSGKRVIIGSWRFTATMRGNALVLNSPTYDPKPQLLRRQVRVKPTGDRNAQPDPVRTCR